MNENENELRQNQWDVAIVLKETNSSLKCLEKIQERSILDILKEYL